MDRSLIVLAVMLLALVALGLRAPVAPRPPDPTTLTVGDTFTLDSAILGERRRINVYRPPVPADAPLPVLYMPDGGAAEDFLHIAGLVQVSVGNGTMRPHLLVGIENTERRRDLTGPTENPDDRKIAPRVGGSAAFRAFVRDELMPRVKGRYRTTPETAVVGESLAGLFVVETFLLEPDLFDNYIAVDPSLWWDGERLVGGAAGKLRARPELKKTLYLATSGEPELGQVMKRFTGALAAGASPGVRWQHAELPDERHATVFHPAALRAFRAVLGPRS